MTTSMTTPTIDPDALTMTAVRDGALAGRPVTVLGFAVFGQLPNALALAGMGLVSASGVGLIVASRYAGRRIAATPAAGRRRF